MGSFGPTELIILSVFILIFLLVSYIFVRILKKSNPKD